MSLRIYQGAYKDVASDDQVEARRREYHALDQVIARLREAQGAGARGVALTEALDAVEGLWGIFMQDVVAPGNRLPVEMRRSIFAISRWMFACTSRLREEETGELEALIEVNVTIRDGLAVKR